MENAATELSWYGSSLQILMYAVIIGAALWLVLAVVSHLHKRAYNLTVAETAKGGKQPDFLDNTGRSEKIREKAIAFDERIAAENAPETPATKACSIVRTITSIAALATFLVAIAGAVARIQMYDNLVENMSSVEHFLSIIRTHWLGATVAAIIILVQLARLVFSIKNNKIA